MTTSSNSAYPLPVSKPLVVREQDIEDAFIAKLGSLKYSIRPDIHDRAALIASCLSSLDDLMAAQSDKLEALKTDKKGLMQQLFPAPEEVGG